MPLSTANWHWKNKNVSPWAKAWFERELTTISIQNEGSEEVVSISNVKDVEGDVELGQRKSKLITIYDCKVELEWSGTASDGTAVDGKLTIPEVSHEITLDGLSQYTYTWTLDTPSSPAVDALFSLAKARLPPALEVKFAEFPVALIDTHGKDLKVTSTSATPNGSGAQTPALSSADAAPPALQSTSSATAAKAVSQPKKAINTKRVTVDATFMASADDLFGLLTDEKRIPSWTRAPAKSSAQPHTDYSLFGGNVRGQYISLTPGKEIIQTWALRSPTWPQDHFATLTTTLKQAEDSTTVTFTLDGVPTGMEDEITRNLQGYYIHGFKSIGLGTEF